MRGSHCCSLFASVACCCPCAQIADTIAWTLSRDSSESSTLLAFRTIRVFRVLQLIPQLDSLYSLLRILWFSLPQLASMVALFTMIFYVYARVSESTGFDSLSANACGSLPTFILFLARPRLSLPLFGSARGAPN